MRKFQAIFLMILMSLSAAVAMAAEKAPKEQVITIDVTPDGWVVSNSKLKAGVPVKLIVTRKTDETCAKAIILEEPKIERKLPLNKPQTITFTPTKSGDIHYMCGMHMMNGILHVE